MDKQAGWMSRLIGSGADDVARAVAGGADDVLRHGTQQIDDVGRSLMTNRRSPGLSGLTSRPIFNKFEYQPNIRDVHYAASTTGGPSMMNWKNLQRGLNPQGALAQSKAYARATPYNILSR